MGFPAGAGQGSQSAEALQTYSQAQTQAHKEPNDPKAGWELGRACFDLADYATNSAERAEIAQQGIAACRAALEHDTNSAPAYYYLALNLGQLARTRSLGALKLVSEMEREFMHAIELDEKFDYAGPDRSLGMLYRDAPSFASIGSRTKAQQHLRRAVELAPLYPENRLSLLESELKWGDRPAAARDLSMLEASWPKSRAEFAGPRWAGSWTEWEARRQQARRKLDGVRLEAPRH